MHLPKIQCLILNPKDNVGILVTSSGRRGQIAESSCSCTVRLKGHIPKGHKVAIKKIKNKEPILKSGQIIGIARRNIEFGEHVHLHNIKFLDKVTFAARHWNKEMIKLYDQNNMFPGSFMGFLRRDGRAGVRNYIVVASTVNCSATVAKEVAHYFKNKNLSQYGIDAIVPITHVSGCAQSLKGYTYKLLNRSIAGWLNHPNVVGGVIIGLGCEMVTLESLASGLSKKYGFSKNYQECINIQEAGGVRKSIKLGINRVERLLSKLSDFRRTELPVSLLTVALKCGGSDVFSSITANPALGVVSDILVSLGGTTVMGEVPECYGAKNLLLARCLRKIDRKRLNEIFSWWDYYAKKNNVNMNDNISLGNIRGGISTILEKSLGAIAKGGTSAISEVVDYAQRVRRKGFVFMNTPGFDPVAVTGMVAGGCNLVAFTTGRGSVYGCSISPTIKIATNSELYQKMRSDMDINAGVALKKGNLEGVALDIYRFLIQVANGEKKTASEKQGLGMEEFVPWQAGEIL